MRRNISALAALALFATMAYASGPTSVQAIKKPRPQRIEETNPYSKAARDIDVMVRRHQERAIELLVGIVSPQAKFGLIDQFVHCVRYASDPDYRLTRFIENQNDLLRAREEMHRFWMNNQPAVLTYDRLNGAIGP